MEIDISHLGKHQKTTLWAGLGFGVLIVLALLGRYYTPGERVLTWQEWQIRKAERLHKTEYALLCQQMNRLAEVLAEKSPEPIRAALIARDVIAKTNTVKSPSLGQHHQAVVNAAQDVSDWGAGLLDYNTAVEAITEAYGYCEP
ncbi:MAG: hypothetical protein ANABAC_1292 [Anaerolineae bacterium]|nr:MAG: hypothetical protein ANABAC_1292 [Anaerolineae bacterium]